MRIGSPCKKAYKNRIENSISIKICLFNPQKISLRLWQIFNILIEQVQLKKNFMSLLNLNHFNAHQVVKQIFIPIHFSDIKVVELK